MYASERTRVVRTAYLVVGSYAVAEELAQEAFLRLHERFDEVTNPAGFLRTAVVRLAISWRRRAARERLHLATADEPGTTGEVAIDETWDALAALSPERRAALVLRFYEDLGHEEIAAAMGCRVGTARTARAPRAGRPPEGAGAMTMTDTELEERVGATLRAKSAQVPAPARAFDPDEVALAPLTTRRRRMPVLVAAVVALVVVVAIGVALVLVDRDESTEPAGEPTGPVSQLKIVALPTLSYQAREFTTEPGLNEIEFLSTGGTHTLVFSDPALRDFQLNSSGSRPERGIVRLAPGRDYEIRDVIPGHAQAGERAVIHVTNGPPGPTKGPVLPPPGDVLQDLSTFPDYVAVAEVKDRPVFVKVLDYMPLPGRSPSPPVYAEDLTTVVGHLVSGRFVPLGQDPSSLPEIATTTTLPPATTP